jgi:hypothetical protein
VGHLCRPDTSLVARPSWGGDLEASAAAASSRRSHSAQPDAVMVCEGCCFRAWEMQEHAGGQRQRGLARSRHARQSYASDGAFGCKSYPAL